MNGADDIAVAIAPVLQAFRSLDIRHFIGGSVASSFHGAARSTMDVDLIATLGDDKVTQFVKLLGHHYYVSEPAVRSAVRHKSCFNLIHYPTSFKIDIFISRDRPFDRDCMARAITGHIGTSTNLEVPLASPEDTIISKLEWYRRGNETSERQWHDVQRVLALLGPSADLAYLQQAAASVGVEDLLARLLRHQK